MSLLEELRRVAALGLGLNLNPKPKPTTLCLVARATASLPLMRKTCATPTHTAHTRHPGAGGQAAGRQQGRVPGVGRLQAGHSSHRRVTQHTPGPRARQQPALQCVCVCVSRVLGWRVKQWGDTEGASDASSSRREGEVRRHERHMSARTHPTIHTHM